MIGFVGLSHLGIISSVSVAAKGFDVIAFDANSELVKNLSKGESPFFEPGLSELLESSKPRISYTSDIQLLKKCEVIYISRDVPTDENNISQIEPVIALFDQVLEIASKNTTIVILSQVSPGLTRRLKERVDKKYADKSVQVYYQVETLIFGNAVVRAMEPERYIIGSSTPKGRLPAKYEELLKKFNCPLLVMGYESAELAKISINFFLVSTVATTNMLAEICEKIGAKWDEIAPALRLDKRIGQYAYLTPGLGIAGGNLERDLMTVSAIANEHGADKGIIDAWFQHNNYRRDWVLRTLNSAVFSQNPNPTLAIWGLAYKAGTNSIKNSPSLNLLENIKNKSLRVYDPKVKLEGWSGCDTVQCKDAIAACDKADALVIMTAWDEFSQVELSAVKKKMSGNIIIDPYGVMKKLDYLKEDIQYFSLGIPLPSRNTNQPEK